MKKLVLSISMFLIAATTFAQSEVCLLYTSDAADE